MDEWPRARLCAGRLWLRANRRAAEERGIALVLAVIVMAALTAGAATTIEMSISNTKSTAYSSSKTHARTAAEAGINQALAILGAPTTNALDPAAMPPRTLTVDGATVTYSGTLTNDTWALTSTATQLNPAGTSNVSYTLTASTQILASTTSDYNAHSYDYIMSYGTGDPSGCDMTIAAGDTVGAPATVAARIYVFGNLCVGSPAGGVGRVTGAPLQVKGKVVVMNSSSGVGAAGTPIAGAHIAVGCQYGSTLHADCSLGNGTDYVWSSPIDRTVDPVTAPVADFASWYANAAPGPMHACTSTTGAIPTWDGDTTRNNSVVAIFNLTPTTSYSCTATLAGSPTGVLSWDASTKVLTISGTMYIDGSAKVDMSGLGYATARYTGQGVLYLSGTFLLDGSKLCGAVSGSNCDWTNWNPNTNMFGIISDGSGGQVPAGYGIYLNDAQFQGTLYSSSKIRLSGATSTAGPVIGTSVDIGYNVQTGGASAGFALITKVPIGLPGVPNAHASPAPPVYGLG